MAPEVGRRDNARVIELLAGGGLRLAIEPSVAQQVERWLPSFDAADAPATRVLPAAAARIRVEPAGSSGILFPADPPTFRLETIRCRIDDDGAAATLAGAAPGAGGRIEFVAGRAALAVADGPVPPDGATDAFSLLTASTALLLARAGRALAHAGAAVDRQGGAWLLVGDSRSGKTTTLANLIRAGWDWLSDDHVVLHPNDAGGVVVEGWPRPFHLDEGWREGRVTGSRVPVSGHELGPGRWRRAAPLAGILLPRVRPALPTALESASASDALIALVRQSPWLMALPSAGPRVLALLRSAASAPAFALWCGLDGYTDSSLLSARLSSIPTARPPRA